MADSITAMPGEIAKWLSEQDIFEDITFLTEFSPRPKATPLKQTIVSVGIDNVKITDKFYENSDGELVADEYCRQADIKIRLSICVPYSSGGTACHEAFAKIVDCLNFNSDLNLKESGCDAIQADRDTDAFVMKGWVDIIAEFCPAESSDTYYNSFLPKTFFCQTHVKDMSMHITPEEREYWNSAVEIGSYFGTDTPQRTFHLGFKPKAVIVTISTYPAAFLDSTNTMNCFFAIATPYYGSNAIEITESGFTVKQNSSQNLGNTVLKLNKLNMDYCFVAFR